MKKNTHWNYRVLASYDCDRIYFWISEVHYINGEPKMHTTSNLIPTGDSVDDLRDVLKMVKLALKKPVLWGDHKFPKEYIA